MNEIKAKYYSDDPNNLRSTDLLIFGDSPTASCSISGACEYEVILYNNSGVAKNANLAVLLENPNVEINNIKREVSTIVSETVYMKTVCSSIITSYVIDGNGWNVPKYRCANDNSLVDNNVLAYYSAHYEVNKTIKSFESLNLDGIDKVKKNSQFYRASFNIKKKSAFSVQPNSSEKLKIYFNVPVGSKGEFLFETDVTNSFLDPAWDTTWGYYRPINISKNYYGGTTDANSMFTVVLDTATLISAGKMRSDCQDLRLVRNNGVSRTELPRMIARNTCNTTATIIKGRTNEAFPNIDLNGTDTNYFYLWYGSTGGTISADMNYFPNLIEYYEFDGNIGLTYYDSSISNNTATALVTTNPVTGIYGNAINFPATASSLVGTRNETAWGTTHDYAMSAFFKRPSTSPLNVVAVVGQGNSSGIVSRNYEAGLFANNGAYIAAVVDSGVPPCPPMGDVADWFSESISRKVSTTVYDIKYDYNIGTLRRATVAAMADASGPAGLTLGLAAYGGLAIGQVDSVMMWSDYIPSDTNLWKSTVTIGAETVNAGYFFTVDYIGAGGNKNQGTTFSIDWNTFWNGNPVQPLKSSIYLDTDQNKLNGVYRILYTDLNLISPSVCNDTNAADFNGLVCRKFFTVDLNTNGFSGYVRIDTNNYQDQNTVYSTLITVLDDFNALWDHADANSWTVGQTATVFWKETLGRDTQPLKATIRLGAVIVASDVNLFSLGRCSAGSFATARDCNYSFVVTSAMIGATQSFRVDTNNGIDVNVIYSPAQYSVSTTALTVRSPLKEKNTLGDSIGLPWDLGIRCAGGTNADYNGIAAGVDFVGSVGTTGICVFSIKDVNSIYSTRTYVLNIFDVNQAVDLQPYLILSTEAQPLVIYTRTSLLTTLTGVYIFFCKTGIGDANCSKPVQSAVSGSAGATFSLIPNTDTYYIRMYYPDINQSLVFSQDAFIHTTNPLYFYLGTENLSAVERGQGAKFTFKPFTGTFGCGFDTLTQEVIQVNDYNYTTIKVQVYQDVNADDNAVSMLFDTNYGAIPSFVQTLTTNQIRALPGYDANYPIFIKVTIFKDGVYVSDSQKVYNDCSRAGNMNYIQAARNVPRDFGCKTNGNCAPTAILSFAITIFIVGALAFKLGFFEYKALTVLALIILGVFAYIGWVSWLIWIACVVVGILAMFGVESVRLQ